MAAERLQKVLAQAGVASRRAAEKYITDGRVRVNGKVVRELGSKADPDADRIEVDGFGVLSAEPKVYIALHKPEHVVSTVKDPEGRTTLIDLLQQSRARGQRPYEGELPRVFPIGRLDFDAEGIILLTNDGELSNRLMHPRHHVPKTYLVKIKGTIEDKQLRRLQRGVRLKEPSGRLSRPTAPADVRIYKAGKANTWLEMTIVEGRNRQIKRMMDAVGSWVIRLVRLEFGGITVEPLPAGAWRFLSGAEVARLQAWSPEQGKAAAQARKKKAASKPPAKGKTAHKGPGKKSPTKKSRKKSPAKKSPARKSPAKKSPANKTKTRKKTPGKRTPQSRKSPSRSSRSAKKRR